MENKEFKPYIVAVYGTLRKGFGNHRLLEHCNKIKTGITDEKFTMYSFGGFPAISPTNVKDTNITVELYEVVDERTSRNLDSLEGYPEWYDKTEVTVDNTKAMIYFMPKDKIGNKKIVENGDWVDYLNRDKYENRL